MKLAPWKPTNTTLMVHHDDDDDDDLFSSINCTVYYNKFSFLREILPIR